MGKFSQKIRTLNDKTKEIITYAFFILTILILVATIVFSVFKIYSGFSQTQIQDIPEEKNTGYVLKEHEGRVAVFDTNENLIEETSIYINSLPELDKALLKSGIDLDSETELKKALEDYE